MAKLKVSGSASGTGTITLIAPATSTDRTITLPDESITLGGGVDGIVSTADATAITIDSSEDVKFHHNFTSASDGAVNGEWRSDWAGLQVGTTSAHYLALRAGNTEQLRIHTDGRGVSEFTAKAWVNFNGTGTVAIRDSHNVSSITDVNTGNYKYNYATAMTTANYAYVGGVGEWNLWTTGNTPNTAYANLGCYNGSGLVDHAYLMAVTFGA
jgi:hypothetical protein